MKRSWFFREGTSDKEYNVELIEVTEMREGVRTPTGLYNVVASWGRRGNANQNQIKTPAPLSRRGATDLLEKLGREKEAKGYRIGAVTAPRVVEGADRPARTEPAVVTGLRSVNDAFSSAARVAISPWIPPMLLTATDREHALRMVEDDLYLAQPKWDGVRCSIYKEGERVFALSRTNKPLGLPVAVINVVKTAPHDIVLDGELVGETYICFDLLKDGAINVGAMRCVFRIEQAHRSFEPAEGVMYMSPTAETTAQKRTMFDSVFASGGEGMVFKLKSAPYRSGRVRTAYKHKFWSTASVIVGGNKKAGVRSFGMYLSDSVYLGNCTVAVNQVMPMLGDVCEVRYLNRSSATGGLVQPNFLRVRLDVDPYECNADQLQVRDVEREAEAE
jgi:hypothetical protein